MVDKQQRSIIVTQEYISFGSFPRVILPKWSFFQHPSKQSARYGLKLQNKNSYLLAFSCKSTACEIFSIVFTLEYLHLGLFLRANLPKLFFKISHICHTDENVLAKIDKPLTSHPFRLHFVATCCREIVDSPRSVKFQCWTADIVTFFTLTEVWYFGLQWAILSQKTSIRERSLSVQLALKRFAMAVYTFRKCK